MRISLVIPLLFGKNILRKDHAFAPGDLADILAEALIERGHEVTLFAPKGSTFALKSHGESIPLLENELKRRKMSITEFIREDFAAYKTISEIVQGQIVNRAFTEAKKRKTDLVHIYSLTSQIPLQLASLKTAPSVFTLHENILSEKDADFWKQPFNFFPHANYVTVSKNQQQSNPRLNYVAAVPNAIDLTDYEFSEKKQKYLAWIGRPAWYKGPDIAIRVGEKANQLVKLASPKPYASQMPFWNKTIVPSLKKKTAQYVGFISGKKRIQFFKNASALLFPIQWNEPFGMVLIEAGACGTPVIAFDKGAVREIIVHGKTGFIVKNEREMVAAVKRLGEIDPRDCRAHIEKNFSAHRMAENYEKVYKKVIKNFSR